MGLFMNLNHKKITQFNVINIIIQAYMNYGAIKNDSTTLCNGTGYDVRE